LRSQEREFGARSEFSREWDLNLAQTLRLRALRLGQVGKYPFRPEPNRTSGTGLLPPRGADALSAAPTSCSCNAKGQSKRFTARNSQMRMESANKS
jgi:hypothetical protein